MSIKQKIKTAIEYTKDLFTTGAFTQTSREVELEICKYIPKNRKTIIVEFGMGHGNITKEILQNISHDSKLYAFEVKPSFCEHVRNTIKDERLIIINDGAENLKTYVNEEVSSIVASIPFSFFSKEKGLGIIQDAYDLLEDHGYYSQVLYTKHNFKKFQKIFDHCEIKKIINIPIEFIYHCKKEKSNKLDN